RLDLYAQPGAINAAMLLELGHHHLGGRGGNIEADTDRSAGRGKDRGIHADDFTIHVEGRATRVTFVDGCIDLNVVIVGAGPDIAPARGYDTGRHGPAETEGVSDGHDPISDARIAVGELDEREAFAGVDLDQGEVGLRIGSDDFRVINRAIVHSDLYGLGAIHNVIVRHGIAISRNKESGAFAGYGTLALRESLWHAAAAKLLEELLERRAGLHRTGIVIAVHARHLCRRIDFDADRDHGRLYLLDNVGKTRGTLHSFSMRSRNYARNARCAEIRCPGSNHGDCKAGSRRKKCQPARSESFASRFGRNYLIHLIASAGD